MEQSPQEKWNLLCQSLTQAKMYYETWWVLKGNKTRPKYVDGMRVYNNFFFTISNATFVSMLTTLYWLYETRNDTINVKKLIQSAKDDGLLNDKALEIIEKLQEKIKPLWIKVSTLRNEYFCHMKDESSLKKCFEKADITPDDFREIIKLSEELLNVVGSHAFKHTHMFDIETAIDTEKLLTDIQST